jgi:type I restriction enzyme S subunit
MRSEFKRVPIDEAVELIIDHRGRTPRKLGGDFAEVGVQVISAKNVYDGRLHLTDNPRFVASEMAARWMPVQLRHGDVLLTSEAPLGEAAYIDGDSGHCLGQRLFALRARRGVANGRFLYYALLSPLVQQRLHARATGTTAQGIKQSELRQVEIDLPDIAEQSGIASVLGALDDKIDSNRRLAAVLEEIAETVFRARFVDFVGVEEFEESEIGKIRAGWKSGIIRDLAQLRYGKALRAADRAPGPVAVVGSSGVIGTHTRHLVEGPAVVIGRKGTVGSVIWVGCDAWPIDTTFVAEPTEGVHPIFLYFMLRQANLPYLTAGTGVPGLNRDAAERHAVLVPSRDAVSDFASVAEPWFKQRDRLNEEVSILTAIRDALLPKLISGEIRVPDTRDPEEVIGPVAEELAAATP